MSNLPRVLNKSPPGKQTYGGQRLPAIMKIAGTGDKNMEKT
jgi:hypothetical protein